MSNEITPFEAIRRTNPAGNEFWSSRDFARVLGYVNYRHFQAVIEKARTACSNSGQQVEDHFVGSDQMVEIGSGAQRKLETVMMSRYACYLVIQNRLPTSSTPPKPKTSYAAKRSPAKTKRTKPTARSEPKSARPSRNSSNTAENPSSSPKIRLSIPMGRGLSGGVRG